MPESSTAAIMLLAWPLITAIIFARMERVNAFIWSMLAGYMFLPPSTAIDLPAVPALSKVEIASLSALLMLWLGLGREAKEHDPMAADAAPVMPPLMKLLVFGVFATGMLTGFTNMDPLIEGITYRPGMDVVQIIGAVIMQFIELIPFFVGFTLLSTPVQTRKLLRALMIALLIYSIPMLIEVRMSPQLNVWVYGYFQHDFIQTIRYNGYRPIVFMQHPIWVASFATAGFLATLCLARAYPAGKRMAFALFYLAGVLILCKTMTAILMVLLAAPFVMFASPRHILTLSMLFAMVALTYPVLRLLGWIPTDDIINYLLEWDAERAGSMETRFRNEFILLVRAMERPYFGWGSWGRNLILDPLSGRQMTIPDGAWVIIFGTRGIIGYICLMGSLVLPIFILWRRRYELMLRYDGAGALMVACVALLLGVNLIELIPNATLTPITWLLNGVVLGHTCRLRYTRDARRRWKKRQEELPEKTGLRPAVG